MPARRDLNGLVWDGGAWLNHPDTETAFVGEIPFGAIGKMLDGSRWWYRVDGVSMRHITQGTGRVASKASAKRAVERCWLAWSAMANVVPRLTLPDNSS